MRLPLLQFTASLYPDVDFSNTALIACQHLLGTTKDLLQELIGKGLAPENVYLLGKCYSTHFGTLRKLQQLGVHVSELSQAHEGNRSYDEQFEEYVRIFVEESLASLKLNELQKVILLDDGGFIIKYINTKFDETEKFVAVEQTSSGFEKLTDIVLRFPVVNVARSEVKRGIESPLIAKRCLEILHDKILLSVNSRVLVIGQGSIGKAIKKQLQGECQIYGCDIKSNICDFKGNYLSRISTFDVIIGATGKNVITIDECKKLKKGTVLVSVSSSDREFPATFFPHPIPDDCHADLEMGGIRLLNSGFPINFDGSEHSLPPEEAQLTRSLLLAGVCEAMEGDREPGLHILSNKQKLIAERFQQYTGFSS